MSRRDGIHDGPVLQARSVLDWLYLGRLAIALAVFGSAILVGRDWYATGRLDGLSVGALALAALTAVALATALSYHVGRSGARPISIGFLAAQAAIDTLTVTAIVLLTSGSDSVFPPLLYILLVSAYALITTVSAGVLIAAGVGVAYLTAIWVAYPEQWGTGVVLQAVIFTVVALASGLIGERLRRVGQRLSTLERELSRLRVGTSDILRTIDAAVVTVDDEGRAVYLNPAAADLLDLDPDETIGGQLLELLSGRAPGVAEALRETFESREPVKAREVEIESDRGPIPHSLSTALLEPEGAPTLATAVLQDLRMARQLEELHLRASRLAVVAELSASLAHEIKNPLASIRSAVEQIAEPSSDADDRQRLSALVVREADRLSRLLGEFNDFARVDIAERVPLDLERLLREAIAVVAERPEARDRANFELEVADGLDDLWGDPDLVHRTLANLLLNAVQVSDPDDTVTVRVIADALRPGLSAVVLPSGMPVRIRVIDDGPGIQPEDIARVFDPFYTRRRGGSGMGLAIAHRAVQAHGGALLVSSTPGEGATFAVVMPRREPQSRRTFTELTGDGSGTAPASDPSPRPRSDGVAPTVTLDGFSDRLG